MAVYRPCAGCASFNAFRSLGTEEEPQFCAHCLVWLPAMTFGYTNLAKRVTALEPLEWLYWSQDALHYLDETPPYMIEDYLLVEDLTSQGGRFDRDDVS